MAQWAFILHTGHCLGLVWMIAAAEFGPNTCLAQGRSGHSRSFPAAGSWLMELSTFVTLKGNCGQGTHHATLKHLAELSFVLDQNTPHRRSSATAKSRDSGHQVVIPRPTSCPCAVPEGIRQHAAAQWQTAFYASQTCFWILLWQVLTLWFWRLHSLL